MAKAQSEKQNVDFAEVIKLQTQLLQSMQEQINALNTNVNVPWPSPVNINIDPEDAYKTFESAWKNYCRATRMDEWPAANEQRKVGVIFGAIGEEALSKYGYFGLKSDESLTCTQVLNAMGAKMVPKKNIIYNRYVFWSHNQTDEGFDIFYSNLLKLITECDYKDYRDEMIRDKIVLGIKDINIKKELLKKNSLTLEEAVNICRSAEATSTQLKNMSGRIPEENIKKITESRKGKCRFCGNTHIFKKEMCPAWGKTCSNCKGRNHNESVCKKKKQVKQIIEGKEENTQSNNEDMVIINKIADQHRKNLAECKLSVKKYQDWCETTCLLDTAADDCLIGFEDVQSMLGKEYVIKNMRPSKKCLFSFGGHNISIHGEIDLVLKVKVANKYSKYKVAFQVVHCQHIPLLSCRACLEMGLVKFCKEVTCRYSKNTHEIIDKYKSVFEGRGSFSGEVDLEVNTEVPTVIQKARRVPVALRPKLKSELERLEEEGIITKETSHTDWVSNILLIQKNDKFRICLDPIPLNKAIKRPNYQFTTVDEILPELGQAKVFSTLDVKKGFWHLNLSEESSKLTTFWTPFGKYRWKVLPFGISSSPDYFQMKMSEMTQGLAGVEVLVDDLLVYGVGESMPEAVLDHNNNLENLLNRLVQYNCKLNKDKMKLLQTSVKYYGHVFTNQGLQPDPSKVEAVQNIPAPRNRKQLQQFLGVVTYLSRFIPKLSFESSHLRQLTHEKTPWNWNGRVQKEFEKLKTLISNVQTLKYYDKNKPLIIECDSSEGALGVAVFQENQPVAYASRCLTPTERKYAQIEKELLAVVFACTRFDQLIVGNAKTVIKTDHKPLLSIFKRPLLHAPKRLQSMLLTLQRYSLELQFVSGKENVMADALSRFYLDCKDIDRSKDMKIFKIIENVNPLRDLPISDNCLKEVQLNSSQDKDYQKLLQYVIKGWPKYSKDIPDALKPFYSIKNDLTTFQGLILKNQAILIPQSLRTLILQKLHKAHSGIENTLKLARVAVFWPSMSKDIQEMIKCCQTCNKYKPSQQKFTMQTHKIPEYPFQIISMDVFFFTQNGKQMKYLVTVDHYSDFFELDILKDLSARSVIDCCKKNFARHGVPERVVTDGGTNFVNQEFTELSNIWSFVHITSSPNHPQGNGKAEATVKIAKKLLLKSTEGNEDFWLNLLCLRNTPNKLNSSPVQRLYSRRTRGVLPVVPSLLKPQVVKDVSEDIEKRRKDIKQTFDKRAKKAVTLEIGQPVSVQVQPSVSKSWTPGIIEDVLSDRSYLVNVNDTSYRRDLAHIRHLEAPASSQAGPPVDGEKIVDIELGSKNTKHDTNSDVIIHNPPQNSSMETPSPKVEQNSVLPNINSQPDNLQNVSSPRPKRETRKPSYLKDYYF